jgi:hypothetical protein
MEVGRGFSPPPREITSVKGADTEEWFAALFGLTTVELRCRKCGDVAHATMPGNIMPQPIAVSDARQ